MSETNTENDFNFKDFILEDAPVVYEEEEKERKKKAKPSIEYNVEWQSGADFIISRKTKRGTSYMCFIINKQQIYIKTDKGEIKDLDAVKYRTFFRELEEPIVVNASWIKQIEKKINFGEWVSAGNRTEHIDNIISKMKTKNFTEAVKANLIHFESTTNLTKFSDKVDAAAKNNRNKNIIDYIKEKITELCPNEEDINALIENESSAPKETRILITLIKAEVTCQETNQTRWSHYLLTKEEIPKLKTIIDKYNIEENRYGYSIPLLTILTETLGHNNTIKIIDNIVDNVKNNYTTDSSGITSSCAEYLTYILTTMDYKPEIITEYISTEYNKQKYKLDTFINEWYDSLKMQQNIYGKIKEKYPKDLNSLHHALSFENIIYVELKEEEKRLNDDKKLETRYETELKDFEYSDDKYIIITPKSISEILDEASMQKNYLASYTERAVRGDCNLFFMRYKNIPEESLVTIEVRNNKIVQAKRAHNNTPTNNEEEFIRKWADKKHLSI